MSAKKKNGGKKKLPDILTKKQLDLSDVGCNICLGILIEPVTLPCEHRMCKVRSRMTPEESDPNN